MLQLHRVNGKEMNDLTDLEGATLAEVARRGTATSYVIASSFAGSPSEYWSGSAGAVYPLVRRLTERGYLEAHAASTGKRQRSDYSITPAGRTALTRWLLDADRAAGMGFDPLRTRLLYLDLVSPTEVATLLTEVAKRSERADAPPIFADRPAALHIHRSWWEARRFAFKRNWLR